MPVDRIRNLVKSSLDKGNIHEALRVYTRSYCSDFMKTECLSIFIDGIVDIARDKLKRKKYSIDSYLCCKCKEIIKDPITLKCGHSSCKTCIFGENKNESYTCPKCAENYTMDYISQLRNSVTIASLVEKLQEKLASNPSIVNLYDYKLCDVHYLITKKDSVTGVETSCTVKGSTLTTTSFEYFKKGMSHWNFGNHKKAFKALLTCFTLDPSIVVAKVFAVMVFRRILEITYNRSCSLSPKNTRLLNKIAFGDIESPSANTDSSSDEDDTKEMVNNAKRKDMHFVLDHFFNAIKDLEDGKPLVLSKNEPTSLERRDCECALCMRIFWQPVTTPCGHTFCRVCLNRCLDHQPSCPLCKTSLVPLLADRILNITEIMDLAVKSLFPTEYAEREAIYVQEMEQLVNAGKDLEHEIPLFICTVALPTVPCPLHVFEPRYRHMIRQCMESGSKQFGMCGIVDNEFAEYGTMLEIRDVQYFPDGRSIVNTIGRKRFKVVKRGERDGYHTGAVEFLEDQPLSDFDLQRVAEKHDRSYQISTIWFMQLPADTRSQILQHFGPMPDVETNYVSSPDGPSWLWWMLAILPVETRLKVLLISLTSLTRRLEFLYRILLHFQTSDMS